MHPFFTSFQQSIGKGGKKTDWVERNGKEEEGNEGANGFWIGAEFGKRKPWLNVKIAWEGRKSEVEQSYSISLLFQDGTRLPSRLRNSGMKQSSRSTPASPSRSRSMVGAGGGGSHGDDAKCTCMTSEQYARLKAQGGGDSRLRGKNAAMTYDRE